MDRRDFLARVTQLFSAGVSVLLSLPVFRFLQSALAEKSSEAWYPIGEVDAITEEVTQYAFTRVIRDGWLTRTAEDYVWVRRKEDGTFVVFEPHCTHLGCAYGWNAEAAQFECPCHGGKFDTDGNRVEGPPPRPLDRFEVRVDNGLLKIGRLKKA